MVLCVNSLLILRLLLLFLVVLFLRRVYEEVLDEFRIVSNEVSDTLAVAWNAVDIENPPVLNNSLYERLRLNEYLAVPQYKCIQRRQLGDDLESFTYCGENGPIQQALIVTGNALSSGKFEASLEANRSTIFLPEGSDLVEHLQGDVEVHYLTELEQWDRWATWDIEYAIRGRTYDVAKLDLYTRHFKSYDQPGVVRQLVQNMTARHLALVINVGSGAQLEVTRVLGEWYRLLYWLSFSEGYALIGASSSGICGQESQNCKYRVSLMRVESPEQRLQLTAPVFGLGSPKEELSRLVKYLNASDCRFVAHGDLPFFCPERITTNSTVLLITYRNFPRHGIPLMNLNLPVLHIVTPQTALKRSVLCFPYDGPSADLACHVANGYRFGIDNHLPHDSGALNVVPYGVEDHNRDETVDVQWNNTTIEHLLEHASKESTVDLIMIDMAGGEVAIYPKLVRLARKLRLNQLTIRGHVWSEENENFRMIYWSLRNIQSSGFIKKVAKARLPRYDIVFVRA